MILRVLDYVDYVVMGLAYGPTNIAILGKLWFVEKLAKWSLSGLSFQWSYRPHPAGFLGQETNLQGRRPSG